MYIKLNNSHKNILWMGCGKGTNTRVELMALWGLLLFDLHKNIIDLQVAGDSRIVVDWATGNQIYMLLSWIIGNI